MDATPKTFHIHASKPTIESLLGIKYIFLDDSIMITSISDESIFRDGGLRIGHEVVQVNGTPILGQTKDSVKTLLGSLGEHVVLAVKTSWIAKMELKVTDEAKKIETNRVAEGPDKKVAKARLVVNYSKGKLPKFLEGRNIPLGLWYKIFNQLDNQLLPALTENYKMDELWKKEITMYEKIQASKQIDIFATGVKHQKQMFELIHTTALVYNSTSTIAHNLLLWLNAALQPYGLLCQLDLETVQLPKFTEKVTHPFEVVRMRGIEFTPVDMVGAMDGLEVSVRAQSEDGSVLTGDNEEIDTTRWC